MMCYRKDDGVSVNFFPASNVPVGRISKIVKVRTFIFN